MKLRMERGRKKERKRRKRRGGDEVDERQREREYCSVEKYPIWVGGNGGLRLAPS